MSANETDPLGAYAYRERGAEKAPVENKAVDLGTTGPRPPSVGNRQTTRSTKHSNERHVLRRQKCEICGQFSEMSDC
jgi:hypothetical protein